MSQAPQPCSEVHVDVLSYNDLFDSNPIPLGVDTYQRGFVWGDDKIEQLVDDLLEYQNKAGPKPTYYMGTLLFHKHIEKEKSHRFVIDGQQRLTALTTLYQILKGTLPTGFELTYSPKSAKRIQKAAHVFRQKSSNLNAEIFSSIDFTVIEVQDVDLAFTFFDTQNNRGVPLHATDLLKAYHLRAVDGVAPAQQEALQSLCASRWESIQQGAPIMSHDKEFAASLFAKFLWRSRSWKGTRIFYGGHDALMDEFQKRSCGYDGDKDTIPLYRSRHNRLGTALTLRAEGHGEIHTNRISLSPNAEELPFAIRQPIHKGIGFFLYADKYAALLRKLITAPTESPEILRFRKVYDELLMTNSLFLREIFLLASLMYLDQFDEDRLWEFALRMEHALGAVRLKKEQVRYEAAQIFFRDDSLNLLDVIAHSYRPDEVLNHLRTFHTKRDTYASEKIEAGKGVQGSYKKAVLRFYGRDPKESLAEKPQWLDVLLNPNQIGGKA
jgi:hypothetical protein